MGLESTFDSKLERLYAKREALAKQLDRAYLRGSISQYITLEERYKQLGLLIESLSKKGSRPSYS